MCGQSESSLRVDKHEDLIGVRVEDANTGCNR